MALQSIGKKKAEIDAARRGMIDGPSDGKKTLIRIRTGLLVGGVLLIALEVVLSLMAQDRTTTFLAYTGVGMIIGWIVLLFSGMFVK